MKQTHSVVHDMISRTDYDRAKFAIMNAESVPVRRGMFRQYDFNHIIDCAHYIILNYEHPTYTYNAMAPDFSWDQSSQLLRASIPHWLGVINAFFRARDTYARRIYGNSERHK